MNLKETNGACQHKKETLTVLFKTKDVNGVFGALLDFADSLTVKPDGTDRKLHPASQLNVV